MADILIRGMEMPTHCLCCPLMVDRYETDACALQSQDANEAAESWDDLKRGCPLVPLPEGHGDLTSRSNLRDAILRDAIKTAIDNDMPCPFQRKEAAGMYSEKIAEAMKVLQDAAGRAVKEGFYGTMYGQSYYDGIQIIHIKPNEAQLDGKGLYYEWGWPGPDFNRYFLHDYGKTWALTKEEITGRSGEDG